MLAQSTSRPARVLVGNKWVDGVLLSVTGVNARVKYNKRIRNVKAERVWLKKRPKKHSRQQTEVLPLKRAYRYRRPVRVETCRFEYGVIHGDFVQMVKDPQYANGVCMFNDNHSQFLDADPNKPDFHAPYNHVRGGGNAQIRPYQATGDAIGMPTGPYGSLEDVIDDAHGTTAKDMVHEACFRTIDLFLKRPDKEILYYSINPLSPEGSIRLGLSIFAGIVGDDVIDYESDCIQNIPLMLEYKRKYGDNPPLPMSSHELQEALRS